MDKEMYGPMCGAVAVQDPYNGGGDASWDSPAVDPAQASGSQANSRKATGPDADKDKDKNLVRQKIEKINQRGGPMKCFGQAFTGRQVRKPVVVEEEELDPGFVVAGVQMEDY